jgi:hypothetical protein
MKSSIVYSFVIQVEKGLLHPTPSEDFRVISSFCPFCQSLVRESEHALFLPLTQHRLYFRVHEQCQGPELDALPLEKLDYVLKSRRVEPIFTEQSHKALLEVRSLFVAGEVLLNDRVLLGPLREVKGAAKLALTLPLKSRYSCLQPEFLLPLRCSRLSLRLSTFEADSPCWNWDFLV